VNGNFNKMVERGSNGNLAQLSHRSHALSLTSVALLSCGSNRTLYIVMFLCRRRKSSYQLPVLLSEGCCDPT
jgi:hypothetical protein